MRRKHNIPIQKIESAENPKIRELRKIQKNPEIFWVIEGRKLLEDAIHSGLRITEIFFTPEFADRENFSFPDADCKLFCISASLMRRVSNLETAPGVLAVAQAPVLRKKSPVRFGAFLLSVRDPGNFGTILRAAEAAGCEMVAYSSDCASPSGSKVIRASMGSIFRVPLLEIEDSAGYLQDLKQNNVAIYALDARSPTNLFTLQPHFPAMILLGSEAHGLPPNLAPTGSISIPMKGNLDSLNVAMAATLCFYHFSTFGPA